MISPQDKEWMSRFMQDLWSFVKKYGGTETYRESVSPMLKESVEISKKYGDNDLVVGMLCGFMNGLERYAEGK